MRTYWFPIVLVTALLFPFGVAAGEQARQNVFVAQGDVVSDNFVRAAQTVDIQGSVQGDVVVAAQTVTIEGDVAGDVLAAAQTIHIRGTVAGNVRLAASSVVIEGSVGKNATIFANTIEFGNASFVGWSVQAFAATLRQRGTVAGNVNFYGSTAVVTATINGNAAYRLDTDGSLQLIAPTVIGGQLSYTATKETPIVSGVTITGKVEHVIPQPSQRAAALQSFPIFLRLVSLFGVLVVGMVLVSLMPKTVGKVAARMRSQPGKSILWGVVLLVVTPLVCVLLLFTVIGIPLAVLLFVLYGVTLYVTRVFAGIFLGNWLVGLFGKNVRLSPLWAMVIGTALLSIVSWVPYVGWLITLMAAVWALGASALTKRDLLGSIEK